MVPLYTDFKLHDICRGPSDPNVEPLNADEKAVRLNSLRQFKISDPPLVGCSE